MIKPIQTRYNGHFFRSRLEARWAVFFDSLRIPYRYEPQGYDTPHGPYLPDFEIDLYDGTKLFEVKPDSWFECRTGDEKHFHVAKGTGMPLYVSGDFQPLADVDLFGRGGKSDSMAVLYPDDWEDLGHDFTVCPYCQTVGIEFEARSSRMDCCADRRNKRRDDPRRWGLHHDRDHQGDHVKLLDAYVAALSARFEHRRTA